MASDIVDTALAAAEKPIAAFLNNVLVQNKDALIAEAKTVESSAIVAIGATIIGTLAKESSSPFFKVLEPHIAAAIEASETAIITALGGEDAAIYALLEHEVSLLAG
jgi:hypothetical protein